MIVHILPPASGFPAVNYNTEKVDKGKGELMLVANFGMLQGLQHLRPEDYKLHLAMVSATNKRVIYPQMHALISAKGKEYDKDTLTGIAEQWLEHMGYGKQPYLIIYHKDTDNNHVHIVTTRIDAAGKKISDSFEKIRAVEQLNKLVGLDEKLTGKNELTAALTYNFATRPQFMMILESRGYRLKEADGYLQLIKFGKIQGKVDLKLVAQRMAEHLPANSRKAQLTAIFHKYAGSHSTALVKGRSGFSSDFSALLKEKFGIDLLFHASNDKPAYGYSVIDHAGRQVFKGSEIVPLKELLAISAAINTKNDSHSSYDATAPGEDLTSKQVKYYAAILKASLYNYTDLVQGLQHQGLVIIQNGEDYLLHDPGAGIYINTVDLLNERAHDYMASKFSDSSCSDEPGHRYHPHFSGISLASDKDDEAVNGRRRRKKVRSNTR